MMLKDFFTITFLLGCLVLSLAFTVNIFENNILNFYDYYIF